MSERFLRAFHAAHPGVTSRAFGRGGSYQRLAARVPAGGRVLDLACGDGALVRLLGSSAIGVDLSGEELAAARPPTVVVQARAQALPFADRSFAAATCHLAFMLLDDLEQVVAELSRVLRPGAPFLALLGGGPVADGDDAFHALAAMLPAGTALGDRRASTEAGWRALFVEGHGWRDLSFERWELDLSGSFEQVWELLGASYQLAAPGVERDDVRARVRARFAGPRVPCRVATYLATVTR